MSEQELSQKQKAFVVEYLKDRNATQAAIRAGYSPNGAEVQGHRLLRNANIARAIEVRTRKVEEKCEITAEMILKGLLFEATNFEEGSTASARIRAWELLGKNQALFTDKTEVTGKDGKDLVPILNVRTS